MPAAALTNLGILAGFTPGESGWDDEMEKNLRMTDCLAQPVVIDKDLATPPGSPTAGDTYIVAAAATGAWTGQSTKIARYSGTAWEFFTPKNGWRAYAQDENEYYRYSGSAWVLESSAQPVDITAGIEGPLAAAAKILTPVPMARTVTFPANFAGSYATSETPAAASTVLSIKRNGVEVGTITFAAAATVGTFTSAGGLAIVYTAGQKLSIEGPTPADSTLGTVGVALTGTRAGV